MASEYDPVSVSVTVTVEMTPEQAQAYSDAHGVGFVSLELAARMRQELTEMVRALPWLQDHGAVTISKPEIRG